MKALVKKEPKKGIWIKELPIPELGRNDVRIKMRKTAICGTDIHIYRWDEWAQKTIPLDMTIGHEFVGEVTEIGAEVTGLKIGQRVSGEGHITCGFCRNCRAGFRHLCRKTIGVGINRPGAFAQYLVIPAGNAFPIPDDISDDLAAILDPFGNATHTALSFDLVGEDVLVTGAGPIGIMSAAIAKHVGARHVVVTDINDKRLQLAKHIGATRTVNITRSSIEQTMSELGMKEGFDVGLEMSGNGEALRSMIKTINHGGKLALLGIPAGDTAIDWSQVILKGLTIKGIYGRQLFETWYKMISMLQSGLNLNPVITHHFPAAEFQQAFEIMETGDSAKVILDWTDMS